MDPEIQFLGIRLAPEVDQHHHRPTHGLQALRYPGAEVIEINDSDEEFPDFDALQVESRDRVGTRAANLSMPHPEVSRHHEPGIAPESSGALYRSMSTSPKVEDVPLDYYVTQVLEVIPDVLPSYVLELVERHAHDYKDKVAEPVLNILFENPDYPKVGKEGKGKGKRKRDDDDDGSDVGPSKSRVKVDYTNKNRERCHGRWYSDLALEQLSFDFPSIPLKHIKRTFLREGSFYVPTYLSLDAERKSGSLSYRPNAAERSQDKGKGKGKAMSVLEGCHDEEFERERQWLVQKLEADAVERDAALAERLNEEEYEETGDGIECGCCFATYAFDKMVQCPEAHLFCRNCMCTYAKTQLGSHDTNIVCMDLSGCKAPFPESELRRFLSEQLLSLYDRVKQQKEIEAAGLENLEECPHCDYKVVIDNPDEKLFRCANLDCEAITCRACKKPNHLPKSCREVEDDTKLDARHVIEEAMTQALMRNCPSCGKAFVKESGCNKMLCPHCRTLSCYVCRKVIRGYDHFNQDPSRAGPSRPGKCPLWDSVEQRHKDEVAAAKLKAMEDYKREHPDVDAKDVEVELPASSPDNRAGGHGHYHRGVAPVAPPYPQPWMPPPLPVIAPQPPLPEARGQDVVQGRMFAQYHHPHPHLQAQLQHMPPPPLPPAHPPPPQPHHGPQHANLAGLRAGLFPMQGFQFLANPQPALQLAPAINNILLAPPQPQPQPQLLPQRYPHPPRRGSRSRRSQR